MGADVHAQADALHRLADLVVAGRVSADFGELRIEGTDLQGPCEEIADGMDVTSSHDWTGGVTGRTYRTVYGKLLILRVQLKYTTDDRARRAGGAA